MENPTSELNKRLESISGGSMSEQLKAWGYQAISSEIDALTQAQMKIGDSFAAACEAVLQAEGKIVVTGLGKSGHVGRKLAATFASTGSPAIFLHASEALHGDLGMVSAGDVVLAIAYGGETHEVLEVVRYAKRNGITVIGLTGKLDSSLAEYSDHCLNGSIPYEADPNNLAPTCSSTVAMAVGDAMAVALLRAKGFDHRGFAKYHPGGALGRKFATVGDFMHTVDSLTFITEESGFHDIIEAVTSNNFGVAPVGTKKNEIMGVISDGDLRRALRRYDAEALKLRASEIMNRKPKMIQEGKLAVEALALMNENKITSIFVATKNNPKQICGILKLHDLIAAKIG